ncbi:breast cancer metastasis-suppressor 1 [Brachionus plicatilis]|uniref:Breast cancer metastasis-suppressor 1 n=1 Tax=Brachionus plicatilis TaxID=10195 RepID=A0A3M7QU96_BRAPC|nr:breast cancer metastasis-suppressor 1 [Brachionus plicatilis]
MTSCQTNEMKEHIEDSESVNSDESEETIADEDEYERRRAAIQSDLKELETLFAKLKEALIFERQILIDNKLKEIEEESAEEFTGPLHKLEQNMEVRINLAAYKKDHFQIFRLFYFVDSNTATNSNRNNSLSNVLEITIQFVPLILNSFKLLKDYKNKNIDHTYQYEEISIKKTLENDKQNLYDKFVAKLEHEIKEMEEKRRQFLLDYNLFQIGPNDLDKTQRNEGENMNLEIDVNFNSSDKMSTNTSPNSISESINSQFTPEESAKKNKKSKKSPKSSQNINSNRNSTSPMVFHGSPFIVYSLQDYDILEDWSIIKMHMNLNKISSN